MVTRVSLQWLHYIVQPIKLLDWCKNLRHNCYKCEIIVDLVLKFPNCYCGSSGQYWVNVSDVIRLPDLKKPCSVQESLRSLPLATRDVEASVRGISLLSTF